MESIQELLKKSTDPVVDQSIFKNFGDGEVWTLWLLGNTYSDW
jgi:hypothetical protein